MHKLILGIALVLTVCAYWPVRDAGFVYEDDVYLTPVQSPITTETIFAPRGLSFLSYRLNAIRGEKDPLGYHGVNVLLHLITGVLVALLGMRISGHAVAGAIAGAAFLVHPLNSEAVAYVTGRPDILAALGVVSGLLVASGEGSVWRRLVWASICIALGAWAKETALVGFPLVWLYLWIVRKELALRHVVTFTGVMLVLAAPILVMRIITNPYVGESERSLIGYAAVQSAAIWRYLGLVIWPVGFSVDHDFELVTKTLGWVALGGLALVLSGVWAVRRRWPLVSFAACWIVVAVGPRFVIQIPEYLNEHQFYLPMVGVCLLIGLGVTRCVRPYFDWSLV